MFWGLIMEPERRYTQTVKRSFHISNAALDITSADDAPTQVMCAFEKRNYLLCTLQKDSIIQVPLDLNFEAGDEISLSTNGGSHVHLTGYITEDMLDRLDDEEDDSVEEEETVSKEAKKRKKSSANGEARKKSKIEMLLDAAAEEDSEDDSDVDFDDVKGEDSGEEEEAGSDEDNEVDDVEEDEAEDEEDEDDEEAEEDEAPQITTKGKQNGLAKKTKQEVKPDKKAKSATQVKENKSDKKAASSVQKKPLEGGVIIEDLKVGTGPKAKVGRSVQVYYEGRLKHNNKMFDSSTKGQGFRFRLGKQEVIKGWDVGVAGMQVGGKRRITCPPNMAYGAKGSPPVIPPNSTLVFEVELKGVQ